MKNFFCIKFGMVNSQSRRNGYKPDFRKVSMVDGRQLESDHIPTTQLWIEISAQKLILGWSTPMRVVCFKYSYEKNSTWRMTPYWILFL